MNKSKKMKLSYVTVLGFLVLGLFSCNNENEILNSAKENQLPEVEVSNLSAWSNGTRSSNGTQAISMAISIAVKSLNTMHHDSMSVNFVRFVHTFPLPHNAT